MPPSDCRRLRFSSDADNVRLTKFVLLLLLHKPTAIDLEWPTVTWERVSRGAHAHAPCSYSQFYRVNMRWHAERDIVLSVLFVRPSVTM